MARYFAGNSLAAFSRTSTTAVEITTAGRFDSAYVTSALNLGESTDAISTPTFSATGTVWVHFELYAGGVTSGTTIAWIFNGETAAYRLRYASAVTVQLQYWNGSTWISVGSTATPNSGVLHQIDIKIILNNSMELFIGGTSVASGSGISEAQTTVTKLSLESAGSSTSAFSQVLIADYDTRNSKFMTAALVGASASNTGAASGAHTDVSETVLDDSTAILISTVSNKAGQTKSAITVPSGYSIAAAVVSARGRVAGGTVTDAKLGFRSGGSNYSSSGLGFNGGYEPRSHIQDTDPATGSAWTQSGFNNAEIFEEAA